MIFGVYCKLDQLPILLNSRRIMTPVSKPHYKRVCSIGRRMITTPEVRIRNVVIPETADSQSPPNSKKERAKVGGSDSTTNIEKTYRKGAPSNDLIEA